MIKLLILFLLTFLTPLLSNELKKNIVFAPLVLNSLKQNHEFLPLFNYIKKVSGVKTEFVLKKEYSKILSDLEQNKIDIALLGPLPYLKLKSISNNYKPIVSIKQKNSQTTYRCVLVKFKKDKINFDDKLKVALTQPLSTCGFYMTNTLLEDNFNISLKNQDYDYFSSHSNTILEVLKAQFDIAGVKEEVAKEFETLGMQIVATSKPMPTFVLVANTKTLHKEQISMLKKLI